MVTSISLSALLYFLLSLIYMSCLHVKTNYQYFNNHASQQYCNNWLNVCLPTH